LSLFGRSANEYREPRNSGLAYLLLAGFCDTFLGDDPGPFPFDRYAPSQEVKDQMRRWREKHEAAMLDAFLRDEYPPLPATGEKTVRAYPFLIPFGRFWRMTSYTHLTACRFLSHRTNTKVRQRLAAGVETLCQAYDARELRARYHAGDTLKPTIRGIRPWPDADVADIGSTALMFSVLGDPAVRGCLWPDGAVPEAVDGMVPLLHEDLLEQFDRYLIEPRLLQYTQASELAFALLVPEPDKSARLDEVEAAIEKCRKERGLSEWSMTRLLEETIFREKEKLPTHTFPRSLGRLLLDRVRPGHYPEGPLKFNGNTKRADAVIEKTIERYRGQTFAERFDQVHGRSPYVGLADLFVEMVKENKGKSVLDVGCGPGQYTAIFKDRGLDPTVIDISPPMLALTRRRMGWGDGDARVVEGDIRHIETHFRGRQFDAIWCCSTIIHFPEAVAEQIVRSLTRLLKPRTGVLMINCAMRNPRLVAEDERFYAYWGHREDFTRVLDACGLRVEKALSTEVSRNVYWEPRLAIRWDSFFCTLPDAEHDEDEGILARARDMTTTAYKLIVKRFYSQHGKTPCTDVVERFVGYLSPGARILDAGCGPGQYTAEFWKRNFVGVGMDLCNEMIDHAERMYVELKGEHADRKFQVGDMCEMEELFEAGSFDGLFCMAAFQHVPVAEGFALKTLKGFFRVLRPGGMLLLDVQLRRHTGFEPDGRFIQGYADVEEVEKLLKEAGFDLVDSGREVKTLEKRNNAFQRGVELHFCSVIARKPGNQAHTAVPGTAGRGDEETRHATCHIHFDGSERGRNSLVIVGKKKLWLACGYFSNLLRLARGVATGEPGIHFTELQGKNVHQELDRLREKAESALECDADGFIEWDGAGFARLQVSPTQLSFNLEVLARHSAHQVKKDVSKLQECGIESVQF
jgi:SAM-dependent methyltransferase